MVIHDAARPLAGTQLFEDVIAAAAEHGGAIPVRDQGDLVGRDGDTPPGDRVVAVQTPQAFLADAVAGGVPAGGRGRVRRHRHRAAAWSATPTCPCAACPATPAT